jgi:choline-sulfatase
MVKRDPSSRPNILLIMTDEHDPLTAGCYGHPYIQTPNLDGLARDGVVFDNAYCNSPLCVPSRMSFLTGRYAHQIRSWDNGSPLRSDQPTIGTYLEAAGYQTALCGRTHMLGPDRLHGFGRRLVDDLAPWQSYDQMPIRDPARRRNKGDSHVTVCGPGSHAYQEYDRAVEKAACRFLRSTAGNTEIRPWLLYVGFMLPHFPLIAPAELFHHYHPDRVQLPDPAPPIAEQHPAIQQLRNHHCNEGQYPEELLRRALASYSALITQVDTHVGSLLAALRQAGQEENTVVIYTSDHGEMAGRQGLWQKMCFYESSVRVPLIVRGPGWARGSRFDSNVSLVDVLPTLLELAGERPPAVLTGRSLLVQGTGNSDKDRSVVFSEYHGQGIERASYMIKRDSCKYIYYIGKRPQMFDLASDPQENEDLADRPGAAVLRKQMHEELLTLIDPEAVDLQARSNQRLFGFDRAYPEARAEGDATTETPRSSER